MCAVRIGKLAKVTLGVVTIAELGSFTLSGLSVDSVETTAFGDEAKKFFPGMVDPGDVKFAGHYDPTDSTGQIALELACKNGTEFGPGDIRFYLDPTTYLTPDTGGVIVITKCKAISMEKSGVATVEFDGKLSGNTLVQISE